MESYSLIVSVGLQLIFRKWPHLSKNMFFFLSSYFHFPFSSGCLSTLHSTKMLLTVSSLEEEEDMWLLFYCWKLTYKASLIWHTAVYRECVQLYVCERECVRCSLCSMVNFFLRTKTNSSVCVAEVFFSQTTKTKTND